MDVDVQELDGAVIEHYDSTSVIVKVVKARE
jgi:hypothetical protein